MGMLRHRVVPPWQCADRNRP